MTSIDIVIDERARLGESPVWSGRERVLYWADTTRNTVWAYDYDLDTGASEPPFAG